MHYTRVAILSAITASTAVLAQAPGGDIPTACQEVCAPVVSLGASCEPRDEADDDLGYIDCICGGQDAETQVPLCEACVRANDNDVDDLDDNPADNDVNDWVRSCSWSTTSWTGSASQPTQTSSAPADNSASPTGTVPIPDDCFDNDDDDRNDPRCSGVTNSAGQVTATPVAGVWSDDYDDCLYDDDDDADDNDDDDYNSPRCQSFRASLSSQTATDTAAAESANAAISSISSRIAAGGAVATDASATDSPTDGAAPAAATAGVAGIAGAAVLGLLMV